MTIFSIRDPGDADVSYQFHCGPGFCLVYRVRYIDGKAARWDLI